MKDKNYYEITKLVKENFSLLGVHGIVGWQHLVVNLHVPFPTYFKI